MSLDEFEAVPLTQEQVDRDYRAKAIQNVVNLANSKVYSNVTYHLLIVSSDDNQYVVDPAVGDVVIVGTDCTTDNASTYNVKVGHYGDFQDSDTNIMIGHNSDCFTADNNIVIGHDTDVNNCSNNIIMGINNDTVGDNNLIIGHSQNLGGVQNNCVVLSNQTQQGPPADGSIIIGGSNVNAPSALPKFQLLSDHIIPLINSAANGAYNPADPAANQATNGWLRLKYQGRNIKIPILDDTDVAIP